MDNRDNAWRTTRLPHGGINQAGVPLGGEGYLSTAGYLTRAVVIKTYFSDDAIWKDRGWAANTIKGVCCDVRTYGRYSRLLSKVPVAQRTHGLHDEDLYIPRESTQDISGAGANLVTKPSGSSGPKPTPAEKLDGDHVLVGFLDCDPGQPIILPYELPHPSSSREIKAADGRVRRIRHAGVVFQIAEDGNVTLDASTAAKEKLGSSGTEVSNSGTGGKVVLKTKDGAGATSSVTLDHVGGTKILGGGGEYIETVKGTRAKISSGGEYVEAVKGARARMSSENGAAMVTAKNDGNLEIYTDEDLEIIASATADVKALDVKVQATANINMDANVGMALTAPVVNLGLSTGTVPLLRAQPPAWTSLLTEIADQIKTYVGPPPPSQVAVTDYVKLLTKLQTMLIAATCQIVKGF